MSRIISLFSPRVLLQNLSVLPAYKRLLVGFSGGADSTALLLALHQLSMQLESPVEAVHFNHGLQKSANEWERQCQQFCQHHNIPLQVQHLDLQHHAGSSFETLAREARYQRIAQLMEAGDMYLTAHQADDQAETLLINLLRGSGSEGLSGIPSLRRLSHGWLARPLLNVSRGALETWLQAEKVKWISDPSNKDPSLERNYLRGIIFPLLEQRWPGVVQRLNHSAGHMRERGTALRELLQSHSSYLSTDQFTLNLKGMDSASLPLKAEIIRNWVREHDALPPPRARLTEFLSQLQNHRADSRAELRWDDKLIKHHAGYLWLHEVPVPAPCPELDWNSDSKLCLSTAHGFVIFEGVVESQLANARIMPRSALPPDLERLKSIRKNIKEIMRLSGIPPWLRDEVPLLFLEGKLSAVGDWWLAPEFRKRLQASQLVYRWQPEHALLKKIQSVGHNMAVDREATLV